MQAFIKRKLLGYSLDEYIIMIVAGTIFLPFYCSLVAVVATLVYLFATKKMIPIINQVPHSMYVIVFCFLTIVVSLIYGNMLGAVCGVGLLAVFLFALFFRATITSRLFEFIVDFSCIASLVCFFWALLEYQNIIQSMGYEVFKMQIEDDPLFRVNSSFFNANYYAMMIEFMILMCVYKMSAAKNLRRIVFYVVTIGCNMFALYLSGCRTAWAPFIITIPLMFYLNKQKPFLRVTLAALVIAGVALLIKPELFPRMDTFIPYLDTRIDIWQAAMRGIGEHPLFGQGSLTYFFTYELYGGPMTQHAHSVILDPLLSFGIVGVALLARYFWDNAREIWHLYRDHLNIRLFSLILATILTVLIHGMMDYTVFWVQTGQLFLIIIGTSSIYVKKK